MAQATASFDAELESVAKARSFCAGTLGRWGLTACEPTVSTLVTELAANSVLHARTRFSVTIVVDGDVLRVGVTDGSPRMPVAKSYSARAMSGRGLRIVAAYADAWSAEPHGNGKTVWVSLRVTAVMPGPDSSAANSLEPTTVWPIDAGPSTRPLEGEWARRESRWAA